MPSTIATPALVDAPDRGEVFRQICFAGILVLQVFAVLAFGAVEPWSIAILQMGSLVLFAIWTASVFVGGQLRLRRNPLFLPMLCFAALVAFQYVTHRTVYLPATRDALLILGANLLLFFVLVNTVDSPEQKRTFVIALVVFGAALSLFALAQDFSETKKIFWWREPVYGGWIYGPYVNHNHYAGFIDMLVLLPLTMVLGRAVRRDKAFIMLSLTALMAVSVLFSASRGGMVTIVAQLALMGFIFLLRGQGKYVLVVVIVAVLLATLAGGVGMVVLRSRFSMPARDLAPGRIMVWRETIEGIRQHFWTGTGLGTFWVVYPEYRSRPSSLRWIQAHNDYLQLFLETGLPGFLLLCWFIWRLTVWTIPRVVNRRHPEFGVTLGVALGIFGLMIHSFVDFNMQIPANALMFFVLCGLLTA